MSQKATVDDLAKYFGGYSQLDSESSSTSEEEGRENYEVYLNYQTEESDCDDDDVIENRPTSNSMASESDNSEEAHCRNDPDYIYSDLDNNNAESADEAGASTSGANARRREEIHSNGISTAVISNPQIYCKMLPTLSYLYLKIDTTALFCTEMDGDQEYESLFDSHSVTSVCKSVIETDKPCWLQMGRSEEIVKDEIENKYLIV